MKGPETRYPESYSLHYNREDRLTRGGIDRDSIAKEPKGIFKRNRSLAIVLIDLLVILLIYGIIAAFFSPDPSTATLGSHRLTLRAFSFGEDLYVTLRTEGEDGAIAVPAAVVVTVEDTSEVHRLLLPEAGFENSLRVIFPEPAATEVSATISVGDDEVSLKAAADEQ